MAEYSQPPVVPLQLCLFKRLTGLACPTCGFTRSILWLLSGQPGRAWFCNPLLCSVIGLFFAVTMVRVLFGRGLQIRLTRAERGIAWIIAIGLLAANWLYVVLCVG